MSVELHPRAEQSWRLLTERAAAESDHRRRVNLEVVARHVREEVRGDVPALMATLVPEPCYEVWGASGSPAPQGHEQVKAFYEASIEIGKNRLEYELSRVVADEDTVLTDGIFRHAYRGDMLVRRGLLKAEEVDTFGWYLVEYRAAIIWPISADGLIEGERMYIGEQPRVLCRLSSGECDHLGPVGRP